MVTHTSCKSLIHNLLVTTNSPKIEDVKLKNKIYDLMTHLMFIIFKFISFNYKFFNPEIYILKIFIEIF